MSPLPTSDSAVSVTPAERVALDVAVLTRQMTTGSEVAYRLFHEAYCDRLGRYLLVVTRGNEAQMRDALQETFRRVVKHIRPFEREDAFWGWLTVLARSAAADEQRKGRRYLAFLDRFRRHVEPATAPTVEADADLAGRLSRQLTFLPPADQELVRLKYFEHLGVRAIADQLATTEGAVESRLVRIRRRLKDGIVAELNHDADA